jgi:hypothetical protein
MQHITLPVLDEKGLQTGSEMLEVAAVPPDRWRLLHSPAFVDGLAGGDVIELDSTLVEGFRLASRSRNVAVIAVVADADDCASVAARELRDALLALGGVFDGGPPRMLVFTVPLAAGFPAIESALREFQEDQGGATWWYGNVYERGDSTRPLDWWRST